MFVRSLGLLVLLGSSAFAAARITPPSPYMSSPPPGAIDTTALDPNRKPAAEIQANLEEAWYGDWSYVQNRSLQGPIEVSKPRKGLSTWKATFDLRGWVSELTYFDAKGKERWTHMYSYPSSIPAGPGDVPFTVTWLRPDGSIIDQAEQSKNVKELLASGKAVGKRHLDLIDELGVPLTMDPDKQSGNENWIYLSENKEIRFVIDRKGRVIEAGELVAPVAAPAPIAPIESSVTIPADSATAK
jgi:hypothetical protein